MIGYILLGIFFLVIIGYIFLDMTKAVGFKETLKFWIQIISFVGFVAVMMWCLVEGI